MSSRKKGNVEGDRLSRLPDDLIHKIMSFVSIKQAVETSVLSPRWRYIWTSMPYLSFSSNDFRTLPKFSNFVKHVLSSRNNQVDVFSVDLTFRGKVSQAFVKRILDYAFSHNVQQLNFTCIHDKNIELPLSLFSSRSLKHLSLTGYSSYSYEHCIMTPPTWELPALATLNLHCVTLHDKGASLFSHCANLKNLTLKSCTMMGLDTSNFKICHPGLSSLTLEDGYDGIDVVTPQLKNLIIKGWQGIHLISAPNLSSLHYIEDSCSLKISADLLYLEKVDVCISYVYDKAAAHEVVSLLQQLYSVKFLSLNLELIKVYWYWSLFLNVYHAYLTKIYNTNSENILVIEKNDKKRYIRECLLSFFICGANLTSAFSIYRLKEFKDLSDICSSGGANTTKTNFVS
ncbi:F-box/FBD/LRR-repeat protein At3g26920 [Helianthus annuus]|uniref:F-box/FBD/LRR-repeat protein At3g26920 n=1 Tax=Helianthus annuus TaxID=4232 RepID=UPI001653383E|nr:F-box/FBD/LRR-repeat protein At3g26920 [Helianthus annuus]